MKPKVAVFTKDNPVKKTHLWKCFKRHLSGFARVQVDEAHSIIGKNAPRYLEKQGYLIKDCEEDGDFYSLTLVGEQWLTSGIKAYAENHPIEAVDIKFFPSEQRIRRRVRAA